MIERRLLVADLRAHAGLRANRRDLRAAERAQRKSPEEWAVASERFMREALEARQQQHLGAELSEETAALASLFEAFWRRTVLPLVVRDPEVRRQVVGAIRRGVTKTFVDSVGTDWQMTEEAASVLFEMDRLEAEL